MLVDFFQQVLLVDILGLDPFRFVLFIEDDPGRLECPAALSFVVRIERS